MKQCALFSFHKQQVMIGAQCYCSISSAGIHVKTLTCLFPILNYFANIVMMSNKHAFPFFQPVTSLRQLESRALTNQLPPYSACVNYSNMVITLLYAFRKSFPLVETLNREN